MKFSDTFTRQARAVAPADFRAQATGIGQSRGDSLTTGKARSFEVGEHMPPRARAAAPDAEGFDKSAPYEGMAEGDALESGFGSEAIEQGPVIMGSLKDAQ